MKNGRLGRYLMLGEGYNIDINDINHITKILNGYRYYVNNVEYNTQFWHIGPGPNDWELKFGDVDKNGKMNIKMLNTSTISIAKEVMSNVAKTMVMFIRIQKPRSIMYRTNTRSRTIAYRRLYEYLAGNDDIMGYHIERYNDNLHYIIKNNVDIRDIIKVM